MLVGGTGPLSLVLSQQSVSRIPHCFLQGLLAGRGSASVRSEPRGVSSRSYAGSDSAMTGAGRVSETTLLLGSSVKRGNGAALSLGRHFWGFTCVNALFPLWLLQKKQNLAAAK